MKDTTKNIIDKLKKLILKHKSCVEIGSVAEAEVFMNAINRLLLEYNLSLSDFGDVTENSEPPKVDIIEGSTIRFKTGSEFRFSTNLADVIAKYNFCRCLYCGLGTPSPTLTLVGNKINVQTCQFLYSFLRNNFTYNGDIAAKKHSLEPKQRLAYYGDFLLGTVEGIYRKFEIERTAQCTAVMLWNDKAITQYLEEKNVNHIKLSSSGKLLNMNAFWKGENHGRNVKISKGIDNQSNKFNKINN